MPELPDLQVFSRNLTKLFAGKKLESISVKKAAKLKDKPAVLSKALKGARLKSVYRSGKELRFQFSNGTLLGLHLMLHGELKLLDKENEYPHTLVGLHFTGGKGIAITDWQKKANIRLDPEDKEGLDALSPDLGYKYLKEILQTRSPVKTVLMDQDRIRGIGNAYADEILWKARIAPLSKSNAIPDAAIRKLAKAIPSVLKKAEKQILKKNPELISGEIRDFLDIHQPKRNLSPTGAKILKATIGGRKTYYTDEQELYE
ncbi:MAG TPA: DNA-formamidopyrimidine glycosylase family protein [Chitinophagaceae bacterium]